MNSSAIFPVAIGHELVEVPTKHRQGTQFLQNLATIRRVQRLAEHKFALPSAPFELRQQSLNLQVQVWLSLSCSSKMRCSLVLTELRTPLTFL
jgi:hypothetical protein